MHRTHGRGQAESRDPDEHVHRAAKADSGIEARNESRGEGMTCAQPSAVSQGKSPSSATVSAVLSAAVPSLVNGNFI